MKANHAAWLVVVALVSAGCWEQVSADWFAQMKWQPAVQALEGVQPFDPPEGTVPLGGIEPRIDATAPGAMPSFMPIGMNLVNPVPMSSDSVARGKYVYDIYCAVCHGSDGMADMATVPVAKRLAESGSMAPLPLVGSYLKTDGFLFTKIRYGKPFMPGYPQIPAEDRWHVVNYLRSAFPNPDGGN